MRAQAPSHRLVGGLDLHVSVASLKVLRLPPPRARSRGYCLIRMQCHMAPHCLSCQEYRDLQRQGPSCNGFCHKTAQGRQPDGPSGLACRRRHTPCTPATKALEGRPGCPALPGASGTVTWPTFTLANTMHKESKGGGHMQACLAAALGLPSRAAAQHRPRSLIEPQHRTHRAPPATPGSACGRGRGRGVPRAGPPAAPLILASTHKPALLILTLQSRLVHRQQHLTVQKAATQPLLVSRRTRVLGRPWCPCQRACPTCFSSAVAIPLCGRAAMLTQQASPARTASSAVTMPPPSAAGAH